MGNITLKDSITWDDFFTFSKYYVYKLHANAWMNSVGPLLSCRLHHHTNMSSFCYNNSQTMTQWESLFEYLEGVLSLRQREDAHSHFIKLFLSYLWYLNELCLRLIRLLMNPFIYM